MYYNLKIMVSQCKCLSCTVNGTIAGVYFIRKVVKKHKPCVMLGGRENVSVMMHHAAGYYKTKHEYERKRVTAMPISNYARRPIQVLLVFAHRSSAIFCSLFFYFEFISFGFFGLLYEYNRLSSVHSQGRRSVMPR